MNGVVEEDRFDLAIEFLIEEWAIFCATFKELLSYLSCFFWGEEDEICFLSFLELNGG